MDGSDNRHKSATEGRDPGVLEGWYAVRALTALEWLPAILVALVEGPKHYSELLDDAGAFHSASDWSDRHGRLHESTLTRALKQLTEDGLIERHESREAFITTVRYTLAAAAEELLDAVVPISDWARHHDDIIDRAWQRRHKREDEKLEQPDV